MSGPLTRERLLGLFERTNEKLARAGRTGEVYIVGGAAMALARQATRVTQSGEQENTTGSGQES